MERIYHLVTPSAWKSNPDEDYRAASLATEGFIHCSFQRQVAGSANRFYADADELWLLTIDSELLANPVKNEPASTGELFPHVYGPINRSAIVEVLVMKRGHDGRWSIPS